MLITLKVSVAARSTFYVALKDTGEYDALFLEELTVAELAKRLANCIGLQVNTFSMLFRQKHSHFRLGGIFPEPSAFLTC